MIISVFKGVKAPKLNAGETPVSSCLAFRVITLEIVDMEKYPPIEWKCNCKSNVWSVRLEGLVNILDCERCISAAFHYKMDQNISKGSF